MFPYNKGRKKINREIVKLIELFFSNKIKVMKTYKYTVKNLFILSDISQEWLLLPILFLFYNANLLKICSSIILILYINSFIHNINLLVLRSSTKKNGLNLAKAYKNCRYVKKR